MKQYDVAALGELRIDLTGAGRSAQGNPLLEASPGGTVVRMLALLEKLGHPTACIGKVGRDGFGDQLEAALAQAGVSTQGIRRAPSVPTTLAVSGPLPGGADRVFYRKPGADMTLRMDELDEALLESCRIFQFTSLSLTDEPCRTAAKRARKVAQRCGALISFAIDRCGSLWDTQDQARDEILYGLDHCQLAKLTDRDLRWLADEEDPDAGAAWLRRNFPHIQLLILTLDRGGSRGWSGGAFAGQTAFSAAAGAGTAGGSDAFLGGVLHYVLEKGWRVYSAQELAEMLRFAGASAALAAARGDALRAMPTRQEIEALAAAGTEKECLNG